MRKFTYREICDNLWLLAATLAMRFILFPLIPKRHPHGRRLIELLGRWCLDTADKL